MVSDVGVGGLEEEDSQARHRPQAQEYPEDEAVVVLRVGRAEKQQRGGKGFSKRELAACGDSEEVDGL